MSKPTFKVWRLTGLAFTALTILGGPRSAQAGGFECGGCATEVTQILNNGTLVSQVVSQVNSVSQLITSYQMYLQQLQSMNLANQAAGLIISPDAARLIQQFDQYRQILRGVNGDLNQVKTIFDTRLLEARLSNLSIEDYVRREARRVASGSAEAKGRIDRERAIAQELQQNVADLRRAQDQLPASVGANSAMQQMNGQLNVLIQQMTKLVSLTSEAQGSDKAQKINEKAEELARDAQLHESITAAERAQKKRERDAINQLRGGTN